MSPDFLIIVIVTIIVITICFLSMCVCARAGRERELKLNKREDLCHLTSGASSVTYTSLVC